MDFIFIVLGYLFMMRLSMHLLDYYSSRMIDDFHILMYKKGYKYDYKSEDATDEFKIEYSPIIKLLISIIRLIPLINVLGFVINCKLEYHLLLRKESFKKRLIPLTESEKGSFSKLISREDQIRFIDDMQEKNHDNYICDNCKNARYKSELPLIFDSLPYLSYTYEEVIELSEALKSVAIFGILDGKKTALIGYPIDIPLNSVILKSEAYNIIHSFEKMSEEEKRNNHYIVISICDNFEDSKELQEAYNNILAKRRKEYAESPSTLNSTQNNQFKKLDLKYPVIK